MAETDGTTPTPTAKTCLVTGATGYVGGRLVPELLAAGHRVRVMTRSPERLRDQPWAGQVEVARADAGDAEVMPLLITANATRNVTKWMPNALCVYSAAPAACGYFVTSSR